MRTAAVIAAMVALGAVLMTEEARGNEIHGQDYYVAATAGWAVQGSEIDGVEIESGPAGAFALGREVASELGQVRAELEVSWTPGDAEQDGQSLDMLGVMMGTRLGFNPEGLNPYIGAGIGIARVSDASEQDLAVAYQGSVGVGYRLSRRFEIDLEYRYSAATEAKLEGALGEFAAHVVGTRITMRF